MEESIVQSFVDEIANIDKVLDPIFKLGKDNEISISDIEKSNKKTLSTFILQMIGVLNSAKKTMRKASIATDKLQTKLISSMDYEQNTTVRLDKLETLVEKFTQEGPTEIKDTLLKISDEQTCHSTKLRELEENMNNNVIKPLKQTKEPLDYSKLNFSEPLQNTIKQTVEREIKTTTNEIQRKNNIIVHGLKLQFHEDGTVWDPKTLIVDFMQGTLPEYDFAVETIISAHFLRKTNGVCTIRVGTSDPLTVEAVLKNAYKLNQLDEKWNKVFLSKDRSPEEIKAHKQLVVELKNKIAEEPTKRWVIQNGTILQKGLFHRST